MENPSGRWSLSSWKNKRKIPSDSARDRYLECAHTPGQLLCKPTWTTNRADRKIARHVQHSNLSSIWDQTSKRRAIIRKRKLAILSFGLVEVATDVVMQVLCNLTSLLKGINYRLMLLRLPLWTKRHATLISAYAPTMTSSDDTNDEFYEDLESLLNSVPKKDKLLVLNDFNVRVGTYHKTWEGIIGRNGLWNSNSNGHLFLRTCSAHDLVITNTIFRLPNRNKTSWMHPRSKHWHLIDYVIVKKKDRQDVTVTKSTCGADCWTDHRLIILKLSLSSLKKRPQGKKFNKRLNATKLEQPSVYIKKAKKWPWCKPWKSRLRFQKCGRGLDRLSRHRLQYSARATRSQPTQTSGLVWWERHRHSGTAGRKTIGFQNTPAGQKFHL